MAGKSRGRGVTAAVGWLLLCAGVVGAIALVIVGERRFDNAIEAFARAQVGCATTLRFTDPGTFFVYEETRASPVPPDGSGTDVEQCVPSGQPGSEFSFTLAVGGGPVRTVRDRSITYEQDGRSGQSYATFQVGSPVTVDIVVSGPDVDTVAAVGRNPVEARDEMRRLAVILGVAGVALGALLLILSGRKSRRASVLTLPDGPGWSRPIPAAPSVTWPPSGPSIVGVVPTTSQRPINPHMPDRPVGSVAPGEPWPSPTQGLVLPPATEPLPRRLPAPQLEAAESPDEHDEEQSPQQSPSLLPAPDEDAMGAGWMGAGSMSAGPAVSGGSETPSALPSEATHDGDHTTED